MASLVVPVPVDRSAQRDRARAQQVNLARDCSLGARENGSCITWAQTIEGFAINMGLRCERA